MHHHGHGHDGHDHDHPTPEATSSEIPRLAWALVGTALLMVVEILGGWLSGSLALLADAGHMLMDMIALGIALVAARIKASPGKRFPSGIGGVEAIASFANCLLLAVLVALITLEARERLAHPQPIDSGLMLGVAIAGLIVNALILRYLGHLGSTSINVRAALLHVAGDLAGSLAVIAGAIGLIVWQLWTIDAWVSLVLAVLIIFTGSQIFFESVADLTRLVPPGLVEAVEDVVIADACVRSHHSCKIYPLGNRRYALSIHLEINCADPNLRDSLHTALCAELATLGFEHDDIAIQFEYQGLTPLPPHHHYH